MLQRTNHESIAVESAPAVFHERLVSQILAAGKTVVLISEIPKWYSDLVPCGGVAAI
jgi:hypothetical protein